MSIITSVASLTYTLTAPLVPAGTMAAFATTLPRSSVELWVEKSFRVETTGCDCPAGHVVR